MRVSSPREARRTPIVAGAVAAAALVVMLLAASGARAAELVYWENLGANTIGVVNADGSGAGPLNVSGAALDAPEGLSYDPVENRLYVASEGVASDGHIAYANLDGSGGGTLAVPAPVQVKDPRGVVVDPVGRIAYWLNNTFTGPETIAWASLDGSQSGELPLAGATLANATRLALDPAAGRLYWGNADGSFGFAPLVGHAGTGGALAAKGAGPISGLAVDPASNRIFWLEGGVDDVFGASLGEGVKAAAGIGAAPIDDPRGLAFDPALARLYWGNLGNDEIAENAIGFSGLGSGPGGITPAGVAIDIPQDPLVIKSPANTATPAITTSGRQLSCSQGSWAADAVSSFVYQAPRTYAYQWTLGDVPIAGATAPTYLASTSGRYKCVVTATDAAGGTSRTSNGVNVTVTVPTRAKPGSTAKQGSPKTTAARVVLIGKARHLKARPGKLLVLRVRAANQGTVVSKPATLCLKLTKGAKGALRAGRCQRLGPLAGGATATVALRLRVRRSAERGLYKLRIELPGSETRVTVRVLG